MNRMNRMLNRPGRAAVWRNALYAGLPREAESLLRGRLSSFDVRRSMFDVRCLAEAKRSEDWSLFPS
jgi:hypothetical protein